jgi:hypothetical protein
MILIWGGTSVWCRRLVCTEVCVNAQRHVVHRYSYDFVSIFLHVVMTCYCLGCFVWFAYGELEHGLTCANHKACKENCLFDLHMESWIMVWRVPIIRLVRRIVFFGNLQVANTTKSVTMRSGSFLYTVTMLNKSRGKLFCSCWNWASEIHLEATWNSLTVPVCFIIRGKY